MNDKEPRYFLKWVGKYDAEREIPIQYEIIQISETQGFVIDHYLDKITIRLFGVQND